MRKEFVYIALLSALLGCRGEELLPPSETEQRGSRTESEWQGFYLLNEGNMGSNKAALDYYDFAQALYTRNQYGLANPTMVQSLGDVGNDIKIYGSKMYAVINCSNLIEVMDSHTAKHIGMIEVPNCRYLAFDGRYGYVTSYAGPVQIGNQQIGYVAKFDTATLKLVDICHVGFQPDELEVADGKLYVANSGGYLMPNYENTLSVVDIKTMTETDRIEVAVNLHRVRRDRAGMLWVSSRGDYRNTPARLYCVNPVTKMKIDSLDIPVGDMWMQGDSLYVCGEAFSYVTMQDEQTFAIIDTRTHRIVNGSFITDGTAIETPYGIAVHPDSGYVYVTDAGLYVNPGRLYCFSTEGRRLWDVQTGDIPAHIVFVHK